MKMDKIIDFYTKYFAVWVIIFGVVAYVFPQPVAWLGGGMTWFFALTMFGIGAVLDAEDFVRIARDPVIVLIGSITQFVVMPLGAFLLAKLFHLSAPLTVGLILTGSAPGAMASNVMSYIAGADTAYSVSLTTVSTILCPVLTPGLVWLLARAELDINSVAIFFFLLKTVLLPLAAGFFLKYAFRRTMEKFNKVFPVISVTFIIFICSVVIALNQDKLRLLSVSVFAVVIILNMYGMIAGYQVGRFFKMDYNRRRTLSIEIGMQNAGLGTTIALSQFSDKPQVALPAALFVFACIITASIMVEYWKRRKVATA